MLNLNCITMLYKKGSNPSPETQTTMVREKDSHYFIIGTNEKDAQVLYKIRTTLGFGTVKKYKKRREGTWHYRYVVSDSDGIQRLIQIFNGQLILNGTRRRFELWLDSYNHRNRHTICRTKQYHSFSKSSQPFFVPVPVAHWEHNQYQQVSLTSA